MPGEREGQTGIEMSWGSGRVDLAEKECPYCFEVIKAKAVKCRFCGSVIEAVAPGLPPPVTTLRVEYGCRLAAGEVADLLLSFVDKSLVAFDEGSDRYRLLETVRQYLREKQ